MGTLLRRHIRDLSRVLQRIETYKQRSVPVDFIDEFEVFSDNYKLRTVYRFPSAGLKIQNIFSANVTQVLFRDNYKE